MAYSTTTFNWVVYQKTLSPFLLDGHNKPKTLSWCSFKKTWHDRTTIVQSIKYTTGKYGPHVGKIKHQLSLFQHAPRIFVGARWKEVCLLYLILFFCTAWLFFISTIQCWLGLAWFGLLCCWCITKQQFFTIITLLVYLVECVKNNYKNSAECEWIPLFLFAHVPFVSILFGAWYSIVYTGFITFCLQFSCFSKQARQGATQQQQQKILSAFIYLRQFICVCYSSAHE